MTDTEAAPKDSPIADQQVSLEVKPEAKSIYKAIASYKMEEIKFARQPERPGKEQGAGFKPITFSIRVSQEQEAPVPPPMEARGRGRGGRGGRGVAQKKPLGLMIRTVNPLKSKIGINVSCSNIKNLASVEAVKKLLSKPSDINLIAIGHKELPSDCKIDIAFFLNSSSPEDMLLLRASEELARKFEDHCYNSSECESISFAANFKINPFVRQSEKTGEYYIPLELSHVSVGKDGDKNSGLMTSVRAKDGDVMMWSDVVRYTFHAEVDFKINHVMMNKSDNASFKCYVNSIRLDDVPKLALSDEALKAQAYRAKFIENAMKASKEEEPVLTRDQILEEMRAEIQHQAPVEDKPRAPTIVKPKPKAVKPPKPAKVAEEVAEDPVEEPVKPARLVKPKARTAIPVQAEDSASSDGVIRDLRAQPEMTEDPE
jgi:hypothetical protein